MKRIKIRSWKKDFSKVKFNKLLQKHCKISLKSAKSIVDRILIGECVQVDVVDGVEDFLNASSSLGALASIKDKKEILIIDDNQTILDAIKNSISNKEYIIFTTTDPHIGLEILVKNCIDLLLIDEVMPKYSVSEIIKEVQKKEQRTTILLLTSNSDISFEGVENLCKPVIPSQLNKILDRHLSN